MRRAEMDGLRGPDGEHRESQNLQPDPLLGTLLSKLPVVTGVGTV